MLNLWRRHLADCKPGQKKGRAHTACSCPIWVDGKLHGQRCRESLDTCDWQRAIRKLAELEDPKATRLKPVSEAITAFEQHILSLQASTQRKYKNVMRAFQAYCTRAGVRDVGNVTVEHLDAYRAGRGISPLTAQKELETLRQFFGFCFERKWHDENPAKRIKSAKNLKPTEVRPYTTDEISRILAACDEIGRGPYERLRARAMVRLLNNTSLRISDVVTLARDRVRDGRILVRTQKSGEPVYLEIWPETQSALDALPPPRKSGADPAYYFWNGITSRRAALGIAEKALSAVFKKSGVNGAHAHRFRHTLATRLLGMGATLEDVADILGNSPEIVRKHYAKWSQARQKRIDDLMRAAQIAPAAPNTCERVN